jgi:hypothetical protein
MLMHVAPLKVLDLNISVVTTSNNKCWQGKMGFADAVHMQMGTN